MKERKRTGGGGETGELKMIEGEKKEGGGMMKERKRGGGEREGLKMIGRGREKQLMME